MLQYFEDLGHSFSAYGPTLSRQITYLYIMKYLEKCARRDW